MSNIALMNIMNLENTMNKPTQKQMFYKAQRAFADLNETFLLIVEGGLTKQELQHNIGKNPTVWSRFSNWLDKLPEVIPAS